MFAQDGFGLNVTSHVTENALPLLCFSCTAGRRRLIEGLGRRPVSSYMCKVIIRQSKVVDRVGRAWFWEFASMPTVVLLGGEAVLLGGFTGVKCTVALTMMVDGFYPNLTT